MKRQDRDAEDEDRNSKRAKTSSNSPPGSPPGYRIHIRTLEGETITLRVERFFTIERVKKEIEINLEIELQEEITVDEQRLLWQGLQLEDGMTLDHYNIPNNDTVNLVTRLRGMISTFTDTDTSNPLVNYLMLSDLSRASAEVPLEALRQKAEEWNANGDLTFTFDRRAVLSEEVCGSLSAFLDWMWSQVNPADSKRVDLRMRIEDKYFVRLLGAHDIDPWPILKELRALFNIGSSSDNPRESKIAFRMTVAPSNACINFHCDGGYATSTVQVAINDSSEYAGGRLCFFVNDSLHVLDRPSGSSCQHPREVLHAVTALTRGTRKSLFVVDEFNGLGEGAVVNVKRKHVDSFLRSHAADTAQAIVESLDAFLLPPMVKIVVEYAVPLFPY